MGRRKSEIQLAQTRATFRIPATPQFVDFAIYLATMDSGQQSKWLQRAALERYEFEYQKENGYTVADIVAMLARIEDKVDRIKYVAAEEDKGVDTKAASTIRKKVNLDKLK